jgi:hypothetical protein
MYRELLERLTFDLKIIVLGHRRLTRAQVETITSSDRIVADKAQEILGKNLKPTAEDAADLAAAQKLAAQIEEFAAYIMPQEIC